MSDKKINRASAAPAPENVARVRLCDYRNIKLSDLDIARARATARETADYSPEEETFIYLLTSTYVEKIVEQSEVYVPPANVRERAINMTRSLEQNLERAGKTLAEYYEGTGTDEETVIKEFEIDALKQLKERNVLLAIARTQGLTATKKEYNDELERLSQMYFVPSIEELNDYLKQAGEDRQIKTDISINKASKYIEKLVRKQVEGR